MNWLWWMIVLGWTFWALGDAALLQTALDPAVERSGASATWGYDSITPPVASHCCCPHLRRAHQDANRPIPEDMVWSLFIQTALALEELHNCKIMHRDVKPEVR